MISQQESPFWHNDKKKNNPPMIWGHKTSEKSFEILKEALNKIHLEQANKAIKTFPPVLTLLRESSSMDGGLVLDIIPLDRAGKIIKIDDKDYVSARYGLIHPHEDPHTTEWISGITLYDFRLRGTLVDITKANPNRKQAELDSLLRLIQEPLIMQDKKGTQIMVEGALENLMTPPSEVEATSNHYFLAIRKPVTKPVTKQQDLVIPEEIPERFKCPITGQLMQDPVILVCDGRTYEKWALEDWLQRYGSYPYPTHKNGKLIDQMLIPGQKASITENELLKESIDEFCERNHFYFESQNKNTFNM